MAAAEDFGRDTVNLVINRTSFQRPIKQFREARHKKRQKKNIVNDCQELVLHWDRNPASTDIENKDRLAIIKTFQDK